METLAYPTFKTCALIILAGACAPSLADAADPLSKLDYEPPRLLTGSIYSKTKPDELLYKFKRMATRSGVTVKVTREYNYPDGRPAARELIVYDGAGLAQFALEELQIDAAGQANIRRDPANPEKGTIEFEYRKGLGGKTGKATEALRENTLVNDMVAPFLISHWDDLLRGEKLKTRYIAVTRKETVGFTFSKESETVWRGHPALLVRMEVTSRLLSALVDPLFFTIEKAPPHRVLQYEGRTTPRLEVRGKWKDLDAITVFDYP